MAEQKFQIQAAPLPTTFRGTPQQLFQALLDRMEVVGTGDLIVVSDTMPDGNQGPWLKGGKQWWVWDDTTSTYVPLDVSASTHAQIYVGDQGTAPDTTQYQFWVKTSGISLVGLYYYVGTTSGWVLVNPLELVDKSIKESYFQDECVSTRAIAAKAVGTDELADNLPLSKWATGQKFQVAGTDGSTTQWLNLIVESAEFDFTGAAQVIEAPHNLGVTPNWVRAVFRCKTAEDGASAGDEFDALGTTPTSNGKQASLMANSAKVRLILQGVVTLLNLSNPSSGFHPTPGNWKIVFYYGKG